MALSDYEKKIWEEMEGSLRSAGFVEEQVKEAEKPYATKLIVGVLLLVAGLIGMIVAVATQIFLIAVPAFVVMFAGAYQMVDGFIYKQRTQIIRPRNSKNFDDIWNRLKNNS